MDIFQKLFKLFMDGGPIIMSSILICSFVGLVIIIERIMYYKKISKNDDKIIERISSAIQNNHYDEALTICETAPSPVTNLMKAGIKHKDYNENEIKDAIKDAANLEIPKLEKHLTTLGTVASIAPLLGLLGTVIGNMEAFGIIGSQNALGNMELLSSGIAKALITTVFGLIVAIPATIFYNYLTNKANNLILALETQANELVLLLNKKRRM
jgi:biopolymer transport protein ExbB